MQTINDVHQQFAMFFPNEALRPFVYLVSKKLAEGHICLDLDEAADALTGTPFYEETVVDPQVLITDPYVATGDDTGRPFVLHNGKLYLQRYFSYETQILSRLQSFAAGEQGHDVSRQLAARADLIRSMFSRAPGETGVDRQLVAAISAVLNQFTMITGGPGTGKTTTVSKILRILFEINPALKVALAAPTGKAAVRMSESLRAAASDVDAAMRQKFEAINPATIHRLLHAIHGTPYFKHDEQHPLDFDVVIVDESSMIDVALFAKLLNAIGTQTKLILLGDKDQLASVEAGSLFGDLGKSQPALRLSAARAAQINSLINVPDQQLPPAMVVPDSTHLLFQRVIELTQSRRFSSDLGIGRFSRAVINGDGRSLEDFLDRSDDPQVRVDTGYDAGIFKAFVSGYAGYIREPDTLKALQKFNQLRVLCAVREGEQGLNAVNRTIEKILQQQKLIRPATTFYENRPLIVNKNYYELGLFNGDVGILRYDAGGVLKAWFEDGIGHLKSVSPGFLADAETVFAMTIHKSQGSEYDRVLVVLPDDPEIPILSAELLYTAVTRARTGVTVQATRDVILQTAGRRVRRASGIVERFEELRPASID